MSQSITDQQSFANEEDLIRQLKKIVLEPKTWVNQPNDQLGGQKPRDFLQSPEKQRQLSDYLKSIEHGMPT